MSYFVLPTVLLRPLILAIKGCEQTLILLHLKICEGDHSVLFRGVKGVHSLIPKGIKGTHSVSQGALNKTPL